MCLVWEIKVNFNHHAHGAMRWRHVGLEYQLVSGHMVDKDSIPDRVPHDPNMELHIFCTILVR